MLREEAVKQSSHLPLMGRKIPLAQCPSMLQKVRQGCLNLAAGQHWNVHPQQGTPGGLWKEGRIACGWGLCLGQELGCLSGWRQMEVILQLGSQLTVVLIQINCGLVSPQRKLLSWPHHLVVGLCPKNIFIRPCCLFWTLKILPSLLMMGNGDLQHLLFYQAVDPSGFVFSLCILNSNLWAFWYCSRCSPVW